MAQSPCSETDIYPTYGVHNPPCYSPCESPDCLYARGPGEPSDPLFPVYWSAKWTMYRVFGDKYLDHLPPYEGKPPAALKEGVDYEVSYGSTYYDSTWQGPDGQVGAMMEHYEKRSLPIFPCSNEYTSSFISLGDTAYFITYDDRPADMPPISRFSQLNHAPKRDFIRHLPYNAADSARLDGRVQAYSLWASFQPDTPPSRTRPEEGGILFGFAYESTWKPDAVDTTAVPYRHPQSFYFSGRPTDPPNAPIVSQNYTEFAMVRPDPAETWDLVDKLAGGKPIPPYDPFSRQCEGERGTEPGVVVPSWAGHRRP